MLRGEKLHVMISVSLGSPQLYDIASYLVSVNKGTTLKLHWIGSFGPPGSRVSRRILASLDVVPWEFKGGYLKAPFAPLNLGLEEMNSRPVEEWNNPILWALNRYAG